MTSWQLQEAKNRLSALIDRALEEGPQVITRHGVEVVVVMPFEGYRKIATPPRRLGDLLLASPLHGSDLVISRDARTDLRGIDL